MFDPSIGRWLQVDPSFFKAGDANLYRYAGNDPTNGTDPSGLAAIDEVGDNLFYYSKVGWVDWHHAQPGKASEIYKRVLAEKDDNPRLWGNSFTHVPAERKGWNAKNSFSIQVRMGKGVSESAWYFRVWPETSWSLC